MGLKMLLSLGLFIGVLYCFHILAQDYQAISAPRLLKLLSKRDTSSLSKKSVEMWYHFCAVVSNNPCKARLSSGIYKEDPAVRWRRILQYDHIQCARYLYCDLGARPPDTQLGSSFIYMLTLNTREEDKAALEVFKEAYFKGKLEGCEKKYITCPFKISLLYDLLTYITLNKE